MPRTVAVLLNLYLVARIVCCPCLTGQNIHDRATRSLFVWGGADTVPADDLGNPEDDATEAGACMCDGASSTPCPECPPVDRQGSPLDHPDPPVFIAFLGVDALAADRPSRPPMPGSAPDDAPKVRARLQNFRC